jgi:hypothetical protein
MLQSLANACGMALQQPKLYGSENTFQTVGCHHFVAAYFET